LGSCSTYTPTRHIYPQPSIMPWGYTNDVLSSLAVGANVHVVLYSEQHFGQGFLHYPGSGVAGQLTKTNNVFGFNDVTSSFRVDWLSDAACLHAWTNGFQAPAGKAVFWTDANYGGVNGTGDCVVLGPGFYPNDSNFPDDNGANGSFGLHNDWMSSVM